MLGATDSEFYYRFFFPKTVRLASPKFHRDMDTVLDGPDPFVNMLVFRGGAKTTKLRLYTGKRIAYGISKTILFTSKSQQHASRSLRWLRKQVQLNTKWAQAFGLRLGDKSNDEELHIINEAAEVSIWIVALGITGSVRGVNFDDYRPDLIVCDDLLTAENTASPLQREKMSALVLTDIKESLAVRAEAPDRKMVLINTPQRFGDISQECLTDPQFVSVVFGCWLPGTENLPIDMRKSIWEEAMPTKELIAEYKAAIARNKLSYFAKEKECKLVTPETSDFRAEWIRYHGEGTDHPTPSLEEMYIVLVIDPVPPPSDAEIAAGLANKDFEALTVLGRYKNEVYVLEISTNKGHQPTWTVAEFFRLAQKWHIRKALVETVAYQKVLAWLIREAMRRIGIYYLVEEFGRGDKRKKVQKIAQGLQGVMSNGQLYVKKDMATLIEQIIYHPNVDHDDELETVAIGVTDLLNRGMDLPEGGRGDLEEDNIPALEYTGGCP